MDNLLIKELDANSKICQSNCLLLIGLTPASKNPAAKIASS